VSACDEGEVVTVLDDDWLEDLRPVRESQIDMVKDFAEECASRS
jgi:hypothetical protein